MKKLLLFFAFAFAVNCCYADCINISPLKFYVLPDIEQTVYMDIENTCDDLIYNSSIKINELNYTRAIPVLIESDEIVLIIRLPEFVYNYTVNMNYDNVQKLEILTVVSTSEENMLVFLNNLTNSAAENLISARNKLNFVFITNRSRFEEQLDSAGAKINGAVELLASKSYSYVQSNLNNALRVIDSVNKDVLIVISSQNISFIVVLLSTLILFLFLIFLKRFYRLELRLGYILGWFKLKYHPPQKRLLYLILKIKRKIKFFFMKKKLAK